MDLVTELKAAFPSCEPYISELERLRRETESIPFVGFFEPKVAICSKEGGVRPLVHLWRNAGDLGNILCQQVDILRSKAQGRTCLLATSLHGGAARNQNHRFGTERSENVSHDLAASIPVGKQQHKGSNPPSHAQHSERSRATVVSHCSPGLMKCIE